MQKLSFVIPCYQSAKILSLVVDEIIETVAKLEKYTYEIILVADGCTDDTFSVITSLCRKNKLIKGINLSRNFGQHSAMMAGFSHCTGDIIVDVDDDGQLPLNELYKLLIKIEEGFDIVVGEFTNTESTFVRRLGTKLHDYLGTVFMGKPDHIHFTSFVVMRKYVVNEIIRYKNAYPQLAGLMIRASSNIVNVPVTRKKRREGKSNYTFRKLVSLWLNGFTAFSIKPLRIASVMGILFSCVGLVYAVYIIFHKLFNPLIMSGWSSLMAGLLIIGGIILMVLGMIGEYIGRIYLCLNNAPQYVIRETLNIDKNEL